MIPGDEYKCLVDDNPTPGNMWVWLNTFNAGHSKWTFDPSAFSSIQTTRYPHLRKKKVLILWRL